MISDENNNDLSNPWSFRNKEETKKENPLSDKLKLKEKINKTLQKPKKHKITEFTEATLEEEEKKCINLFKKNVEKELEIFESERRDIIPSKNKGSIINIDCTLSDLNIGKGTLVTKDDLIIDLPSCFLNKTKFEDIGNTYTINVTEINRLVPNDNFVAELHSFYSQNQLEIKTPNPKIK